MSWPEDESKKPLPRKGIAIKAKPDGQVETRPEHILSEKHNIGDKELFWIKRLVAGKFQGETDPAKICDALGKDKVCIEAIHPKTNKRYHIEFDRNGIVNAWVPTKKCWKDNIDCFVENESYAPSLFGVHTKLKAAVDGASVIEVQAGLGTKEELHTQISQDHKGQLQVASTASSNGGLFLKGNVLGVAGLSVSLGSKEDFHSVTTHTTPKRSEEDFSRQCLNGLSCSTTTGSRTSDWSTGRLWNTQGRSIHDAQGRGVTCSQKSVSNWCDSFEDKFIGYTISDETQQYESRRVTETYGLEQSKGRMKPMMERQIEHQRNLQTGQETTIQTVKSGVLSSTVTGRGQKTDNGVEFDNDLQTTHYLDPTLGASRVGRLCLTGADAARLKEAAAEKSSIANRWIADRQGQKDIAKDIKDVIDHAKASELSTGNSEAFARELASRVDKYDAQSVQKFDTIQQVVGKADPATWTSNENQRKILSHMGRVLSA
ncbi:J domain-containing protein [Durusdinium trenchii]|uniref:J domain-containing protein n=1 Tax=Durusdinium trenchii TaxID=1381693 RepID=A0ABP0M644_9DINO